MKKIILISIVLILTITNIILFKNYYTNKYLANDVIMEEQK